MNIRLLQINAVSRATRTQERPPWDHSETWSDAACFRDVVCCVITAPLKNVTFSTSLGPDCGSTLLWLCGPDSHLSDAHSATECLKCLRFPFRCLGAQLASFRSFGMSRWKKNNNNNKKKTDATLARKTKLQQHARDVVLGVKCQHHRVVARRGHVGVVMFSRRKV